MNTAGKTLARPGSASTPPPAGGLSPIPFAGFSPAANPAATVGQGRGVASTPGFSAPAGGNRLQQPAGGPSPASQAGAPARANSPLPPRPASAGKPAAVPTSRFAGTPGIDALTRPPQSSPTPPLATPNPPVPAPGVSPAPGKSPALPAGSTGGGSGGSKANRKRQPQPMAGGTPANAVRTAEVTPAPRRKKRKVADKHIPERVVAVVPESAVYNQLLEVEKRIDATLLRKKQDIQEALRNPPRVPRILRLYVTNTYANQGARASPQEPPSWTLSISGRILEEGEEAQAGEGGLKEGETASQGAGKGPPQPPAFSTFLRRLTVELDPAQYGGKAVVAWEAARAITPVDGFEVRRAGAKEFVAKMKLELNYTPQRFQLSPKLASLVGTELETRPRIIASLWQYIKARKLQNPADPTMINCDAPLQEIFGEARIKMSSVTAKLHQHLSTPQPISVEHHIRLSGPSPVVQACYDIAVDVPAPLQKEMSDYLSSLEKHRDIDVLDELIANDVRKINEHRKRRAFFLGFSQSPVDFIYGLMASQHRDLRQAAGDSGRDPVRERHSDFYKQPWVEDAVLRYLNRRPAGTTD